MPTLTIRNLDHDAYEGLKARARRHGRSMESEARDVLSRASRFAGVAPPAERLRRVQEALDALVPEGVSLADELIAERRAEASRD